MVDRIMVDKNYENEGYSFIIKRQTYFDYQKDGKSGKKKELSGRKSWE